MPQRIDYQDKQFEELMNVLRPDYAEIPTELKSRNQWVYSDNYFSRLTTIRIPG